MAGDRLTDGRYEPVPIETVEDGILQGYSAAVNLFIRWEHGELRWHDPETGQHIVRYTDLLDLTESEREARIAAEDRAESEWEARSRAKTQRDAEQEARVTAEA